jgi:ADP-dependent NAD(P)H-hydrate dehydratase / NAD(P)H-hydrate epimerase
MTEILSSAQMRAVEAAGIESGAVSGLELMERAGAGVVAAISAHWPDAPRRAAVLCGPGNNGGDGYVIARLLAQQGWQVALAAPMPPATPDAQANAAAWAAIGPVQAVFDDHHLAGAIFVDALFGTGLARPLAPSFWQPLAQAQACGARIVAVDILSGLCADSGRVLAEGAYLPRGADLTVTFQTPKLGHMLMPAGGMSGLLECVDIGLGAQLAALIAQDLRPAYRVGAPSAALLGKGQGHKFDHGHAFIPSGGVGRGGAARLAARAALRIGAGLVTLGCPPAAVIENAARLDAIMLRPVKDAAALAGVLADARVNALCLGPGLGLGAREGALVAAALASKRALVLDADALSLIAQSAGLRSALHRGCVLTPHAGEFARLWPDLAQSGLSKPDATRRAAKECGAHVLFKGADTVIASPEGQVAVHSSLQGRSVPWLATAGAGDVLAGFIAGLLARGVAPFQAAKMAVWLHVDCALAHGPGLIAEDLPEALPDVLRALGV